MAVITLPPKTHPPQAENPRLMFFNHEQEQFYLRDLIQEQEKNEPSRGFDIDREFGEGIGKMLEEALRKRIQLYIKSDNIYDHERAGGSAAQYRVLFDQTCWTREQAENMKNALRKDISRELKNFENTHDPAFARFATYDTEDYITLFGQTCLSEEDEAKIKDVLESDIKKGLILENPGYIVASHASAYRIISGKRFWTEEDQRRMENAITDRILGHISGQYWISASENITALRILRAHDIQVIPGEGIKIIDNPPEKPKFPKTPPLPEQRAF